VRRQRKLSHLIVGRRTTDGRSRLRPLATHEFSMPAQKRLWPHDQAASARRRQESRHCGKEGAIGWPEPRTSLLPAKHGQLVAQHEQLDVFSELAAPAAEHQPQHS
jgi:hypothetical protein